jgi:pimeloyl-ACP methyl ester carboxylesterase
MDQENLIFDDRLFISGYSQGGQVAMALARLIESDPRSHFRVTAAAPASGPYDAYETARVVLSRNTVYVASSIYAIYAAAAYQATYDLPQRLDELLTPSMAAIGEKLLTVGMTAAALAPLVPRVARDALQPEALDALLNDADYPLSRALRANQTYDWLPSAPLRMYYGEIDIDVPPSPNAIATADHMHALGAEDADVQAVRMVGPNLEPLNHNTGLWISIIKSRQWFDSFPPPPKGHND